MIKAKNLVQTGITWIPEIPSDWELKRIKLLFDFNKNIVGKTSADFDVLSLTTKGVIKRDLESGMGKFPASFDGYQIVKPNSIMLCLFDMDVTPRVVGHVDDEGIISAAYTNIIPKKGINSKYYYYYFLLQDKNKSLLALGTGIRITLNKDFFGTLKIPAPPLSVQNNIVAYLDKKNSEIDKFVRNKERLIEIILERQENEISNIITKGLNKSEFKDSESKWIGKIPTDWNLIPLGYLLKYISYGFTNPMPTTDEGPFMLTANDVGDGEIYFDTCRRTSEKEFKKLSNKSIPSNGDILVTKDGTLGRTSIFNGEKSCINQSVALLRVSPKYTSGIFIETVLRSKCYQDKMIYDAEGTTIKHIYITKLVKMKIALPEINEQEEIIKTIDSIRNENRNAVEKISKEISSIKEYREALITDLVTGKRSVPQFQMS
jgi:type I restriction enzyme S subunit